LPKAIHFLSENELVSIEGEDGGSLLNIAIYHHCLKSVQFLLERNVFVNFDSDYVSPPLGTLVFVYSILGGSETTDFSCDFEQVANEEAKDNQLKIARLLLDAGADMSSEWCDESSLLEEVVSWKESDPMRLLFQEYRDKQR